MKTLFSPSSPSSSHVRAPAMAALPAVRSAERSAQDYTHEQALAEEWRALGLITSPRREGGATIVCPRCVDPRALIVGSDRAHCNWCAWGAVGPAAAIAQAGARERDALARGVTENAPVIALVADNTPEGAKSSNLPPITWGHEIADKEIILPEELIAGILHRGAKMVLGGGSKSFKTWCLAALAISIAAGREWWGRKVRQGRVIYLNLEVQGEFFEKRLQSIAHAKGMKVPPDLGVWNLRGHCCDHSVLLPKLSEILEKQAIAAIILDPTYKVMAGSENAQEVVAALMDSIEKLAKATGAAVIFGSHFAKGSAAGKEAIDRISGSGVFVRDPDAILTMTRHEEKDAFAIDLILRNCPQVESFCVRWEFPLMCPAPDLDVANLKEPAGGRSGAKAVKKTAEDMLRLVPVTGSIDKKVLANHAHAAGFPVNSINGFIIELITSGELHEWGCPRPGTNQAKLLSRHVRTLL